MIRPGAGDCARADQNWIANIVIAKTGASAEQVALLQRQRAIQIRRAQDDE